MDWFKGKSSPETMVSTWFLPSNIGGFRLKLSHPIFPQFLAMIGSDSQLVQGVADGSGATLRQAQD